MNKIKLFTLLTVLFSMILLGVYLYESGQKKPVHYNTSKVEKGVIKVKVSSTGVLDPLMTVQVGSQISGTIQKLFVDFNDPVKRDQVIAQLDPALYIAQVKQAEANLIKAQAQASLDKTTLSRSRELREKQLIAQSELDTAEANYQSSLSLLQQVRAALDLARTNLNYTTIRSPVNGIVISRNVDIGQTVAASLQTPTLFTIARDLREMQIDANVSEADIGSVETGQSVFFTVDAYPGQSFEGKVIQVRNSPLTVQNVVTYDVVISVKNPDVKLKPGMTATVSILTQEKGDVIKIPGAALRFIPGFLSSKEKNQELQTGGDKLKIWILRNHQPVGVEIKTGISDGNYYEVTEGDLKEGDEIIIGSDFVPSSSQAHSFLRLF